MFIPHAKAISPVFAGVNSTVTDSFRGNALLIFSDGKTTSVAQVLSVVLSKVRRAGMPARRVTLAGFESLLVDDHFRALKVGWCFRRWFRHTAIGH